MSLLNFKVWPDRALVGVDTFCSDGNDGDQYELSKALLLPHTNVLFAFRGGQNLLLQAFGACFMHKQADFDGIDSWLLGGLNAGYEPFVQAEIARGVREDVARAGAELLIIGYSHSASEMRAMRYVREPNESEFVKRPKPWGVAPDAGWGLDPIPDAIDVHQAIARDQVAFTRREHPGGAIGGRLLVIELTKDTATFREVCELG